MAKTPFVEIIEKEVPRVPQVASLNEAVVLVIGTASSGPFTPVLVETTEELYATFVADNKVTEAVKFAEDLIRVGAKVLFKRVVHPGVFST